jgi:tetratricopeptide (TPR) repeat protein
MLAVKPFFFIYNMLKRLKKIVDIEDEVVIYEIHHLLEKSVFTPTSIEAMADNIESVQAAVQKIEIKTSSISPIIMSNTDIDELKNQLDTMDVYSAQKLIKEIIRKAKAAEKDSHYQITLNEYNKALFIAKDFKIKDEIKKISQKIFKLEHKSKNIELDFNIEKAENAEKYGDFINSINYYQKALEILDGFKVYNITDPRIKKFKKKIFKLREEI